MRMVVAVKLYYLLALVDQYTTVKLRIIAFLLAHY